MNVPQSSTEAATPLVATQQGTSLLNTDTIGANTPLVATQQGTSLLNSDIVDANTPLVATQQGTSVVNSGTVGANTDIRANTPAVQTATYVYLPPVATADVILQIAALTHQKRQSGNTYLTPNGPGSQTVCDASVTFTLVGNELVTSDGRYLSTTNGVSWMTFTPSYPKLPISTQFTIDSNGYLVWQNVAFVNNVALFCEEAGGQIDVLFQGQTDIADPTYPLYGSTCTPVALQVMSGKFTYYLLCLAGVFLYRFK